MTQNEVQRTYEEDRNSINSKDFMIGALVGGIIGAATALFVAPKAGKELRNDITEQARNISEKTDKLRRDITETAKEKTSTVSEVVSTKSAEIVKQSEENEAEQMSLRGWKSLKLNRLCQVRLTLRLQLKKHSKN